MASNSAPVIEAVVFDLDGLMFNTEDVFFAAGTELLRRRSLEMTPAVMNVMLGRRPHEAFANLRELLRLTEEAEALLAESQQIFSEILGDHLAPMPGLFVLLERIEARGLPKGVATSSPRGYLEDLLARYGLLSRFDVTLTAGDVTHGKPHPEIYLTAAERLGVVPGAMLVLEDSEAGTKAAAAAGAVAVSVPHFHTQGHDFSGARHIVTRLDDPVVLGLVGEPGGKVC